MSGPVETLRLVMVEEDGSSIDLGLVRAEVEPRRGAAGMVSAEGTFPPGPSPIAALIAAQLASVKGEFRLWRIAPPEPGSTIVGRYELEAFDWRGDSFSLLISRDARNDPVIARPIPDDEEASEDGPN